MSCFHRRQSKEMDSVNCATSAAGPAAKRPLRETGDFFAHSCCLIKTTVGRGCHRIFASAAGRPAGFGQNAGLPTRRRYEMFAPRSP